MDDLIGKLTGQAVQFVGKAALGLATKVTMDQLNHIFKNYTKDLPNKKEIEILQKELEIRLNIVLPAIELIEVSLAQRNSLFSNVSLMIEQFKLELKKVNELYDSLERNNIKIKDTPVIKIIEDLIKRLDSLSNYLQLVLSLINNNNLESNNKKGINSPSRLLQASTLLTNITNDIQMKQLSLPIIVRSKIPFQLFTLFSSNIREPKYSDLSWKETFPKCYGYLERCDESYNYQLIFQQDLKDDRYHEEDEKPAELLFNIKQLDKMFYSSSGQLLRIEGLNDPVLVLKLIQKKGDKFEEKWIALNVIKEIKEDEKENNSDLEELAKDDDKKDLIKKDNDDKKDLAKKEEEKIEDISENFKTKVKLNDKENELKNDNLSLTIVDKLLNPIFYQSNSIQLYNNKELKPLPGSVLSLFENLLRLASAEFKYQTCHILIEDERLFTYLK